jgi:hypothetical protein
MVTIKISTLSQKKATRVMKPLRSGEKNLVATSRLSVLKAKNRD